MGLTSGFAGIIVLGTCSWRGAFARRRKSGAGAAPAGVLYAQRALGRRRVTVRAPLGGLCLQWLDGGEASGAKASNTTLPCRRKRGPDSQKSPRWSAER